jgi:hypothetical protein
MHFERRDASRLGFIVLRYRNEFLCITRDSERRIDRINERLAHFHRMEITEMGQGEIREKWKKTH